MTQSLLLPIIENHFFRSFPKEFNSILTLSTYRYTIVGYKYIWVLGSIILYIYICILHTLKCRLGVILAFVNIILQVYRSIRTVDYHNNMHIVHHNRKLYSLTIIDHSRRIHVEEFFHK